MSDRQEPLRELFVDELSEVKGGGPDYSKIIEWLREQLLTTMACGEEGPC